MTVIVLERQQINTNLAKKGMLVETPKTKRFLYPNYKANLCAEGWMWAFATVHTNNRYGQVLAKIFHGKLKSFPNIERFNSCLPKGSKVILFLLSINLVLTLCDAKAEIPKEIQKTCLKAADYQGCVKANMSTGKETVPESTPQTQQTQNATDRYGLPSLDRKRYKGPLAVDEGELYYDMNSFRTLKNKGEYGRYLAWEMVARWIAAPVAPTPGQNIEISGPSSHCSGYSNGYANASGYGYGRGFSMNGYSNGYASSNCYTTPGTSYFMPGTPGDTGGPRQKLNTFIVDCIDRKVQTNKRGAWKSIEGSEMANLADKYCPHLSDSNAPKGEEI